MRTLTTLTLGLTLLASTSWAGDVSLERAVTDAIQLPAADIAVVPKTLTHAVAIRMAPKSQWLFVDLTTGATEEIGTIDALRAGLKARADKAPRDGRVSKIDLYLVADSRLEWSAMQQAMMAAAMSSVARIWIVGKRADGEIGALPAFLPVDHGIGPRKVTEAHLVKARVRVGGEDKALLKAEDLYDWAWRTKQDSKKLVVRLNIAASSTSSIGGVAALLNEARRFGFAVTFDGAPSRAADAIEKFGTTDPTKTRFLVTAPKSTAKPPRLELGKALSGDPSVAPVVVQPEMEEVEEAPQEDK